MEAVMDPDSKRDQVIEELIRLYQTPLLRLCYIQLQDRALAEDAVQETFLKAYRGYSVPSFFHCSSFTATIAESNFSVSMSDT